MRLDYIGTAIFFAWVSFAIFRWVARTAFEIREPIPRITALEEEVLRAAAQRSGEELRRSGAALERRLTPR
jgi:hypothetical protein